MAFIRVFGEPTLHGVTGVATTEGTWIELPRAPLIFGRGPPIAPGECVVQLPQEILSRRHFAIEPSGDGWQLRDLNSTSGTFVNRSRAAQPHRLREGDVIEVNRRLAMFTNENGGGP